MAAAAHYTSCVWMLALGACVALAVDGADCGKECALCVYRLLGEQQTLTSVTCSLECEGGLDSRMLRLCRDTLLEDENQNLLDDDPGQQQEQEAAGDVAGEDEDAASPQHQLAKKYGGFMKRYGGFMSRRSPSSQPESTGTQEDEERVRMEILKVLNADHGAGDAAKRYGGFMRRAGGEGEVQGDLLEAVLGRGLKKRYGGFMRRIGRPEWLVEDAKNGGAMKRTWEDGSEIQKRYGGFMD